MTARSRSSASGLAVGLLLVALAAGKSRGAPSARPVIEAIRATEDGEGNTALAIAVSARPTFTTWKLDRPSRVVVDLSGARLGKVDVPFDANTFAVGAVSAVESAVDGGLRTRVVFTLRRPADYQVEAGADRITVRVRPHEKPAVVATAEGAAAPVVRAVVSDDAARAKLAAEVRRLDEERARADAARRAAETERTRAEAERLRAEAARSQAEEARARAEQAAARLESLKQETEARRREAERAQAAADARRAEAEQKRAAADARHAEAEKAQAVADARRAEAEKAQAAADARRRDAEEKRAAAEARQAEAERTRAAAEARRADAERTLELAETRSAELAARERALASAEAALRQAKGEAESIRRSAEEAEARANAARREEASRGEALRAARAQVDQRRQGLEATLAAQEEQRRKLAASEKVVAEREAALARAAEDLERRERAARAAAARLAEIERQAGATAKARQEASLALERAERARQDAAATTARGRQALVAAERARQVEEERRAELERARKQEEERLALATRKREEEEARRVAAEQARKQEEVRMAEAVAGRTRLEADRARLEAERERMEAERAALKADIARLEKARAAQASTPAAPVSSAPIARASAPAVTSPLAAVGTVAPPVGARAVPATPPDVKTSGPPPGRPASITLQVPSRVQRIDFVDEPTRSSVIIVLDDPSAFRVETTGTGRRLGLRLLGADLPRGLERSLDATEYLGPVRVVSSYRDPRERNVVRVDVELAEEVPSKLRQDVRQDGARLYWDFTKPVLNRAATAPDGPEQRGWKSVLVQTPRLAGFSTAPLAPLVTWAQAATTSMRPPSGGKRVYAGRRIDLDMKSADIQNLLRLLAEVGGVNIVASDDVKGEVTLVMKNVPWDQALDVVLRQKQLGQVREGNLIRVAPLAILEKELEQEIARQKQITEVLPTETRLIPVSYADARQLIEKVRDLLSPRGKVSVDERTNTMVVSDVTRNLGLVEELVRNLDTQTSQVVIEARIVEARSAFVRQIGIQWGGTGFADALHGNPTGLVFPYNIGIGGAATDARTPIEGLVPAPRSGTGSANPNFAVNLPAAAGTGSGGAIGLTLGSVAGAFNLNLRLSALESTGQVRILSSPRVATLDNEEASIEQGVSIPISVVSAQGVQTIFVDAKLSLTVKPHVTNEGTIMMNLEVTRNEPDFVNTGARGDPTILKKRTNTKMLVRDGDTAVIGGIYQRNSGLAYSKVPFLADLPIVGALFRTRRENDDRTEFLVFITPRIANRARAVGQE